MTIDRTILKALAAAEVIIIALVITVAYMVGFDAGYDDCISVDIMIEETAEEQVWPAI